MKNLIISHIADIDGVSPVILLNLCKIEFDYELKNINDIDQYITELLENDLSIYNNIYITDLTLSEETYEHIINSKYKEKFKVFDHHKSHLFADKYDFVDIDINECATTVFYKYLCKEYNLKKKIIKQYIEHVKNLDIWLWQEKNDIIAKQLGDLFGIYGRENYIIKMTKRLKSRRKFKLDKFDTEILKIEQDKIDRYIDSKNKDMIVIDYEGYKAGLVFCERYKSEMGNTLSVLHPELDFIIMINVGGGISFRTNKDIDLTLIAEKINGGGHPKACGAPINEEYKYEFIKNTFKGCVINENR